MTLEKVSNYKSMAGKKFYFNISRHFWYKLQKKSARAVGQL